MNQIASIAKALIRGDVLTIMDGFSRFRCSNIPREISRSIERKFDVEVSRERVEYKTEDGLPGHFFRYRLNHTEYNLPGIERMKIYILERSVSKKTKESKFEQPALF